jgi:GNAT superfamily N-acetyltransferase
VPVEVQVREIAGGEHEQVADLTVAAYAAIPGDHMSGGYERELRDVQRRAAEALVLVAVIPAANDRLGPVGAVAYVADRDSPWAAGEGLQEDESLIRMLAVDPAHQGCGAGAALVEACIARARVDRKRALMLHTTPWMGTAHRLYERLGFVRRPDRDMLAAPDVPLIAYGLDLSPR